MSEPNFSINYSARRFGSTVVARGNVLIQVENNTDYFTVATTANRNGRRSTAISLDYLGSNVTGGTVSIQQTGTISAELSGLSAGVASWVRCSSTGTIERCTPATGDDIIGYAEADGRVHLMFGVLKEFMASGSPQGQINVKDYGAVGDGVADDTAAIQAAVAAVKLRALATGQGARLHFPAGVYLCSSMLDFDSTDAGHLYQSVTLYGDGGGLTGSWRSASTLIYTGGDVRAFISARSSAGFSIQGLAVLYNNSAFEGTLVDLSHSAAGYDTNNATLSGCIFASDGALLTSAKNLILLDGTICSVIENCTIYGAVAGIRGVGGTGYTVEHAAGYVNRVTIYGCSFDKCTLGAIVNPGGQGWVISNNTFELISMPTALTCDATSGGPSCSGLRFEGNWLGDCNTDYNLIGAVHNNGYLRFQGASFDNNYFGLPFEKRAIVIGPSFGVSITGNVIGTIDFSLIPGEGTLCQGVTVSGNYLQGDNAEANPWFKGICQYSGGLFVGMLQENRVFIAGNNHTSQGPLDHRVMSGHLVTIPTLFTQPTILGVTNVTATLDGAWYKGSNDIAGRITLVSTGGGGAAGSQCTLTFKLAYDSSNGTKPKVVLMPENAAAATVSGGIYVDPDFDTFDIVAPSGLPAGTYVWAYHVFG